MREILDAVFYVVRGGCAWRLLPHEFPPWKTVVASGPFDLSSTCQPGTRSDFVRGPYTGRMQAWHNCEVGAAATFLTLSAAPKGRECVVLMQLAMYGEADVEVGQHILDAFEVKCAAAATYPLAAAADEQQYAPEQYAP